MDAIVTPAGIVTVGATVTGVYDDGIRYTGSVVGLTRQDDGTPMIEIRALTSGLTSFGVQLEPTMIESVTECETTFDTTYLHERGATIFHAPTGRTFEVEWEAVFPDLYNDSTHLEITELREVDLDGKTIAIHDVSSDAVDISMKIGYHDDQVIEAGEGLVEVVISETPAGAQRHVDK